MRLCSSAVLLFLTCASCSAVPGGGFGGPYVDHTETADLALLRGGVFDRDDLMSDAFFRNTAALDETDIQALLVQTPYGASRCFLADEQIGGRPFSEVLVETTRARGLNPLLLLARMQVEKSLISRSTAPERSAVDFAFGCGCPDGRSCSESLRGLDRQVECAASTHDRLFQESVAGTGSWRRGSTRSTSDPIRVTPRNHATAALYGYTPWVLEGRGGNWLVWNVVNRFVDHLIRLGRVTEDELATGADPPRLFIGSACTEDAACTGGLADARCHPPAGYCVLPCEGYCPDRAGHAPTFCVSLDGGASGSCVPKSHAANAMCGALPATEARGASRHVGSSRAPAATAVVCLPRATEPPLAPEPPPAPPPAPPAPDSLCDDSCRWPADGECDDGGEGSLYAGCALGTDCTDCGARRRDDPGPGGGTCDDTCAYARDGACDDGGPGAAFAVCALGTDCADCGVR